MAETITDKTEALAAVKNNPWALESASDELKTDPEILALIPQMELSMLDLEIKE